MTAIFTKSREPARPGSIPDRLQMFTREVRFYTEIAPAVGVRVPAVFRAEARDGGTVLELDDLSPSWTGRTSGQVRGSATSRGSS